MAGRAAAASRLGGDEDRGLIGEPHRVAVPPRPEPHAIAVDGSIDHRPQQRAVAVHRKRAVDHGLPFDRHLVEAHGGRRQAGDGIQAGEEAERPERNRGRIAMPLHAVLARNHRLAREKEVSLEQLTHHPMVLLNLPQSRDDQAFVRALGARFTPEVFVFDGARKLRYHGRIDDNHRDASRVTAHDLKNALDALLEGKDPPVVETTAFGCSVKWK